jgi:two-component system, chemotaxis family, chemotaxis protein CheY
VIFLTAHAKARLVEQARAAGVSAFLTKPVRPALLRDRIMSVASQIWRTPPNAVPANTGPASTGSANPSSSAIGLPREAGLESSTEER